MSALSSALLTGLSGLEANQTELSVVGNNIANANTTAFKSSSVLFSPQFYVTENTGTPVSSTAGGSNPSQVGLGTQVSAIQQNLSQGELQTTGVPSDLAINGAGYFVIQNSDNQQLYTRDGAFQLNADNQLVDSSGDYVLGYGVNSNYQVDTSGGASPITIPIGTSAAQATSTVTLTGALNAGGTVGTTGTILTSQALQSSTGTLGATTLLTNLQSAGGTSALYNVGDTITLSANQGGNQMPTATYQVTSGSTVQDLENFFQNSLGIETSLPSGSTDPTPGVTLNASGELVVTGNVGTANAITINSLNTSNGDPGISLTQTTAANGESDDTSYLVYDSLGNPITLNVNSVLTSNSNNGSTWEFFVSSPQNQGGSSVISSGTLSFNNEGQLTGTTGANITLNRTGTGAEASQPIALDFTGVQSLANSETTSTASDMYISAQNGFATGTLESYSIGSDGTITGSFTNGLTETVGQVALATFANPSGLVDEGNNQYAAGANSGAANIGAPGSNGSGALVGGSLEMSNVDLSQEFINLITASTGYDASSRVISTSDQLLTELLNSQQ
jgi:flagellar hook protein FlgE